MSWEGSINTKGAEIKYNPKTFPQIAEHCAGLGYTNLQIAKKLSISHTTYYKYVKDYPEFAEGIEKAKKVVDDKIEQKLFKRASGYSYTEVTRERVNGKMTITKKTTKKLAPDVVAMIFWLKNRRPETWRDRREVAHSGEIKTRTEPDLSKLSPDELDELERITEKACNGQASRN